MNEKIMNLITISGIVFQFALTGFLCYMFYIIFKEVGQPNEMLLGVLTGLVTGIGLANMVSFATKEK